MASAAINTAAHTIPPAYTIPLGPRVRPPRLLPGTKAENTNPQPAGPVPENGVWVQGKWRNPSSNAAKDRQLLKSKQVEKALRHHTHGMNIYAYRQILTNQVVYSLTRSMQNNKILPQLVYHKKKSVPAALRRDVWRPHFSIHFPQTPAGAQAGLQAYHQLREIALKRQLSPPREMLIATQEDVDKERMRINPADLKDMFKNHHIKDWPRLNQMLPLRYRARKLMDQKASSVADAAYVLGVLNEGLSPAEKLAAIKERREQSYKDMSRKTRRRLDRIAEGQNYKLEEIKSRQQGLEPQAGQKGLDKYTAERIALEYGGALTGENHVAKLQDIQSAETQTAESQVPTVEAALREAAPAPFSAKEIRRQFTEDWNQRYEGIEDKPEFPAEELKAEIRSKRDAFEREMKNFDAQKEDITDLVQTDQRTQQASSRIVQILWADKRDGTYAESWPDNVYHGWLDSKAVLKREMTVVRQAAQIDEDGQEISEQKQKILVPVSNSSHIFGRDKDEGWFQAPGQQLEDSKRKAEDWNSSRREGVVREMINLRSQVSKMVKYDHISLPEFQPESDTKALEGAKREINASDKARRALEPLETRHPVYKEALDEMDQLISLAAQRQALQSEMDRQDENIEALGRRIDALDPDLNKFQLGSYRAESDIGSAEAVNVEKVQAELLELIRTKEQQEAYIEKARAGQQEERDMLDEQISDLAEQYPNLQIFEQDRWQAEDAHRSDPTGHTETRLRELTERLEGLKVELVLDHHRKLLEGNDDDAAKDAQLAVSRVSGAYTPEADSQDPDLSKRSGDVDPAELEKMGITIPEDRSKGVWQRVKGVFGR